MLEYVTLSLCGLRTMAIMKFSMAITALRRQKIREGSSSGHSSFGIIGRRSTGVFIRHKPGRTVEKTALTYTVIITENLKAMSS